LPIVKFRNLGLILLHLDAHGRGERGRRGAPHVPPQKTLKKWVIKMQ